MGLTVDVFLNCPTYFCLRRAYSYLFFLEGRRGRGGGRERTLSRSRTHAGGLCGQRGPEPRLWASSPCGVLPFMPGELRQQEACSSLSCGNASSSAASLAVPVNVDPSDDSFQVLRETSLTLHEPCHAPILNLK